MPMGPPSQMPAPKSALRPAVGPTLETHVDDCACTGNDETSACQNELAGVIGHAGAPGTGRASPGPAKWSMAAFTARAAAPAVQRRRRKEVAIRPLSARRAPACRPAAGGD